MICLKCDIDKGIDLFEKRRKICKNCRNIERKEKLRKERLKVKKEQEECDIENSIFNLAHEFTDEYFIELNEYLKKHYEKSNLKK